ncbi:MAG TPA: class I SAM-dependent methyltransferase [Burkholderiales bacterium]|nr:class I SAM-dependent methyltransferase [Burkholderiales bacterium]
MSERDYHDSHYEHEAARILGTPLFARVHDRSARDFLRRTGIGRAHRVLSLGCGDGSLEARLAPHVGEIVGTDVSPVAVEQAQARAKEAGAANLSFLVSDPGEPFPAGFGQFDCVTAFAFLHHLGDGMIRDTLIAARARLRSGGVFYSSDPSRRRLVRLFARFVSAAYDRYHSPDERELDPEALLALAEGAGFTEPQITYVDYFLGPLAWLAPGTPSRLVPVLAALDDLALSLPLLRRFASSFSLTARIP